VAKDPVPNSPELDAYLKLRDRVVARFALPDGAANAPSDALRGQMSLIVAQADAQAGIAPATHEQQQAASYPGGFEQLLRDTDLLTSLVLPSELYRLAVVVASA
jgi:hypothetical protein